MGDFLNRQQPFLIENIISDDLKAFMSFSFYLTGNLSNDEVNKINAMTIESEEYETASGIANVHGRISRISELTTLAFKSCDSTDFEEYLYLIDSSMPYLISELLLTFHTSKVPRLEEVIEKCAGRLKVNSAAFKYKVKELLLFLSLGMKKDTLWGGYDEEIGPFMSVKTETRLESYTLYSRGDLKEVLLKNSFMEERRASEVGYAEIETDENERQVIRLDLQISLK